MPTPNRVLFAAYTPAAGTELWVSDGTAAGTSLLKDIAAGKGSSSPGLFTQFGGLVVFEATDATHGTELWVTDGTTAGTSLLKDINPGSASGLLLTGNPALLTRERPAGGQMVFAANDGVSGQELWVTNGTTAGTSLLQDIYSGSSPSNPEFFATFGTGQLFEATDGLHRSGPPDGLHGQELWVTDGTAAGTALVADLVPDVYGSGSPRNMVSLGTSGRAVFSAAVGSAGRELWVTDGSAAGTSMLADIRPGAYKSSNPGPATPGWQYRQGGLRRGWNEQSRREERRHPGHRVVGDGWDAGQHLAAEDVQRGLQPG